MKLAGSCLQLDVGNSGSKWRLLEEGRVVARGTYRAADEASLAELLNCTPALQQIWVASVAGPEAESELAAVLAGRWGVQPWFARSTARCGAVRNRYDEPERLGVDRWLAMLAGWQRMQARFCVVDAGSALTFDVVSDSGEHEGGYIIPGPVLMERALLQDTGRVRFAEDVDYALTPGLSTAEAVRHGIALAQTGALALAMDRAGVASSQLLFCGGGGDALRGLLDRGGDYQPDLVFEGLEILAGNSEE
ncbi:MAG: type III pantothenate kinase [Pseudomonadales bacterium]|nr:type III pantothenate kinase [Pseudomonadales bacterium]